MPGPNEDPPAEIDPQDAFQLFSHELRLEILYALWETPGYARSFSEIQEVVGERDSGKFSYHLGKLTDQFVTEIEDQYVLQYAGHRVIDAIQSGVFHTSPSIAPLEAPGECARCGESPVFEYDSHLATVSCPDCETKLVEYPFDPGGFQDRSMEAAIEAFDRRTKSKWRLASDGVCFVCAGRVTVEYAESAAEIETLDRYDQFFAADHPAVFHLSCENCSFYSYVPVGIRLLDTPAVVGQLATRGVDVADKCLWELPFVTDGGRVTVKERDPWTVSVEAATPSGTLQFLLDDEAAVESFTVTP